MLLLCYRDTEVMLIVDTGQGQRSSEVMTSVTPVDPSRLESTLQNLSTDVREGRKQNVGIRAGQKRRFLSTVEIQSSLAVDGHLTLTPVAQRSVEVTIGQSGVGDRSTRVTEGSSFCQEWMTRHHLDHVSYALIVRVGFILLFYTWFFFIVQGGPKKPV